MRRRPPTSPLFPYTTLFRSVKQDEGGVSGLVLQSGVTETADLYVDASGFASVLLSKALAEPFVSFASSLFCDRAVIRSEEHTSELQSRLHLVCRLLLEKKK